MREEFGPEHRPEGEANVRGRRHTAQRGTRYAKRGLERLVVVVVVLVLVVLVAAVAAMAVSGGQWLLHGVVLFGSTEGKVPTARYQLQGTGTDIRAQAGTTMTLNKDHNVDM